MTAAIEFISFDARDVITTSGLTFFADTVADEWGWALSECIASPEPVSFFLKDDEPPYFRLHTNDLTAGNYYIINSARKELRDNTTYFTADITSVNARPSGNELDTLENICDYLKSITRNQ